MLDQLARVEDGEEGTVLENDEQINFDKAEEFERKLVDAHLQKVIEECGDTVDINDTSVAVMQTAAGAMDGPRQPDAADVLHDAQLAVHHGLMADPKPSFTSNHNEALQQWSESLRYNLSILMSAQVARDGDSTNSIEPTPIGKTGLLSLVEISESDNNHK
eukprot:7810175-Karenia_brevis.AAC.1